jgi:mono/diheme cytochrome c family protein
MTVFRAGLRPWPLLAALAIGCDMPGKPNRADRPVPSDQVTDFGTLYRTHCAGCHGADGKLGPAPPLNDPLFLSIISEGQLRDVVRKGRRGTPMPAFVKEQGGPLTDDQVKALARGIKTQWGKQDAAGTGAVPPYKATSAGSAQAGKAVFMQACAVCHGERGQGVEKDDQVVRRINDPAFLALISDQALRRYVITGRPDLGMPSYAGKRPEQPDFKPLTATEVDDLVALLSSWAPPDRPGRGKGKDKATGPATGHK